MYVNPGPAYTKRTLTYFERKMATPSHPRNPSPEGLYHPAFEHDSCGVGFICHMKGQASHDIVIDALRMLENMSHRGASGADPESGDGAGLLATMPHEFLRKKCEDLGIHLPPPGQYACGTIFFPQDVVSRRKCKEAFRRILEDYGMVIIGWRDVPVNAKLLSGVPKESEPRIKQVFVAPGQKFFNRADFDRRLYLVRQRAENEIEFGKYPRDASEQFYICVLSANRTVYKGMLTPHQLRMYYPDLQDPDFKSSLAMVHSRFSTNTFPTWRLAHPFRYLSHNGEINTLRGNRNWMRARYSTLRSEVFGDELKSMFPILTESGSDSATLDNAIQFLAVNGRSLSHSVLMLIPEAWQNNPQMDPELKAFYEYHSCIMEPWDGPASIAFTNGYLVGAVLDRNGLRPSRYCVTKDDLVIMSSETGALPVPPERVAKKWRLQPGRIFLVDMKQGRIIEDAEIKRELVDKRPWRRWIGEEMVSLDSLPEPTDIPQPDRATILIRQHAFGYSYEDVRMIILPMAVTGQEPLGSMGNDTPLACLSEQPRRLYDYFKQLFAQVTNPPLDAIREELVTSTRMYLGGQRNILEESPQHCHLLSINQPILTDAELAKVKNLDDPKLKPSVLPMLFRVSEGADGLAKGIDELCERAAAAVREGSSILILSDRDIDREHAPVPALLAVAAVHNHLILEGTRLQCSLVVETGDASEVHHFCLLIGYGASAVNPYLVFETLADLARDKILPAELTLKEAEKNYVKAANKGILKVASKMGISTIQSYWGAQVFEALGISDEVIEKYFTSTVSRIRGIGLDVIARECLERHRRGFPPGHIASEVLNQGGLYKWRRGLERHMWSPDAIAKLQHSVRSGSYSVFKEFSKVSDDEARSLCTIRGLLNISKGKAIPLKDVEPAAEIAKRFVTGAMSFGSISREAHENLAIAMNRLGGKSNTGEGGEDPARYRPDPDGTLRRSAIKQVASGRFGVTIEYLNNATEIQIKMAQGAKPGEGGQLPGHKVDEVVGRIRYSTPGVGLISPPPHHDIYSIEDLAQLTYDLKNANPHARISVKLVSEAGVGTVATGVAKCKAEHIVISGDSGGTGASPLTSIKHAGLPWELGLAEAQQTLVMNNLRGRVVLQTDGQLKTGRDVIVAALLGAEEFGFATAPLIALGCVMMRKCHTNNCPVGVATQDPDLRKKFTGKPEHVMNFMLFVAEEVREILAEMGFRRLDDIVGRTDLLSFRDLSWHWKARTLDLDVVLYEPEAGPDAAIRHTTEQEFGLEKALDNRLIELAAPALENQLPVTADLNIRNTDRTVGTMLSGRIVEKFGHTGLPESTITFTFKGSAGQSFGAFLARGLTLRLEGDANDYLGKGLSGGTIAVYPPSESDFRPEENIIAGNVICYGAIAGEVYIRGVVGERFCVRNSGANAVVEGCGDHGCEYMTGGRVVVLGETGRNFAAGMSGGIAYTYHPGRQQADCCNLEMVSIETLNEEDLAVIHRLLENHRRLTGSERAAAVLAAWEEERRNFVKVMPIEYRRVLERRAEAEESERILEMRLTAA